MCSNRFGNLVMGLTHLFCPWHFNNAYKSGYQEAGCIYIYETME